MLNKSLNGAQMIETSLCRFMNVIIKYNNARMKLRWFEFQFFVNSLSWENCSIERRSFKYGIKRSKIATSIIKVESRPSNSPEEKNKPTH